MENETWDGSIERIVITIDTMVHDDAEDEVVQTPCIGQCAVPYISCTET